MSYHQDKLEYKLQHIIQVVKIYDVTRRIDTNNDELSLFYFIYIMIY